MIVFRYLLRQVYPTMLGVTAILLFAVIFAQLIHYLNYAASGRQTLQMALELTLLQIPLLTGYVLGLGLFIGILVVYNRMYADSEMTVLFACGYSRLQLVKHTLIYSSVIMVIVAAMSLWIQPKTFYYKGLIVNQGKTSLALLTLSRLAGQFQTLPNDRFIYIGDNGKVFLAEAPKKESGPWNVVLADKMDKHFDPKTQDWLLILKNGAFYTGVPGKHEARLGEFKEFGYFLPKEPTSIDLNRVRLQPTSKLLSEQRENLNARAELQMRLSMPLTVLILALIAVPLSQIRNRQSKYLGFFWGIVLYSSYMIALFVFQNGVASNAWFARGSMLEVHAIFALIALFLMWFKYKRP